MRRNPKHPDFTGLGVLVDANTSSGGAARVPRFTKWVTDKHREQAEIYKQRRLFIEEQGKVTVSRAQGARTAFPGSQSEAEA